MAMNYLLFIFSASDEWRFTDIAIIAFRLRYPSPSNLAGFVGNRDFVGGRAFACPMRCALLIC